MGCLARARPPPANLSQAEHKALKCLREDDSIVIAPADKGNITVVMDRSEYEGRIQTLLDDTETYRRLKKDPTMAQERKMNGLLLTLMRSGAISERLYQRLRSSAGKVPLLYGLPKVHKPGPLSGLSCPLSTLPHTPCRSIWSPFSHPWSADPIHMSGIRLTLCPSLQIRPWHTTW